LLQKEKENKDAALEAEAKERRRAEEAAWNARQVLNFFTQVSEDEFPDKPELRPVRRKLLEAALGYYKDFIEQSGDDPSVQAELDASRWRIASILEEMGQKEDAQAIFEQLRGGLRWPGSPMFGVSSLLTQPAVQQDLKLSDEQVKAIAALTENRREPPWLHHNGDDHAEDFGAKERACFEVLRPEQAKRLRQVVWQRRGAHAFADPDVADALQLTPEQRQRIHKIEEDSWRAFWLAGQFRDRRPDAGKRPDGFWKGVSDRLLAVLTDEQKARWKEMLGEPFQGEIRFGPPPFFPPPYKAH